MLRRSLHCASPAVALERAQPSSSPLHGVRDGLGYRLCGVPYAQADDLCVRVLLLVRTPPPANLHVCSIAWGLCAWSCPATGRPYNMVSQARFGRKMVAQWAGG